MVGFLESSLTCQEEKAIEIKKKLSKIEQAQMKIFYGCPSLRCRRPYNSCLLYFVLPFSPFIDNDNLYFVFCLLVLKRHMGASIYEVYYHNLLKAFASLLYQKYHALLKCRTFC